MHLFDKIKKLFEDEAPAQAPAETSFVDVKSQDGTLILRVSAIEVDGTIEVINEDGSLTPYEGTTILEDGSSITAVAGKITEVAKAEAEAAEGEMATEVLAEEVIVELAEEPAADAPAEEAPKEDSSDLEKRVSSIEAKMNELIDAVNKLAGMNETMKAETEVLAAKNEELSKAAAAPKSSFKRFEKVQPESKGVLKDGKNFFLNKIQETKN